MKRLLLTICLLALGVSFAAAQTATDHLQAGDRYFAKFDDASSLAEYEAAAKLQPGNFDALWKTAQAYMNVGDRVPRSQKNHDEIKQRYFQVGSLFLERALRLNSNDSRAHFLKAAILGRQVRALSRKRQVEAAYIIKAEIDRALALDPSNDLAWHSLAYWNRTLAEVSGAVRFIGSILFGTIPKGSYDEAIADFRKAIAINPNYSNHHFELARTYLDLGKKDLAKKELEAAIACPDLTSMCSSFKDRAFHTLERLQKSGEIQSNLVEQYFQQKKKD